MEKSGVAHQDLLIIRAHAILCGTATHTNHKKNERFVGNVVVGQRSVFLELLAGKDETLLVGRDALLVLDLDSASMPAVE
jgi:hypothetical protein